MQILSQRNPQWADVKIGPSNITVGRYGCTITCISMLTSYFGNWVDPEQIALKQLFTKDGLIIWTKLNLPNIKFDHRGYGRNDVEIMDALKDPNKAVILQVQNYHWVVALGRGLLKGYRIADPWFGDKSTTARYKDQITGYAIFKLKP